MSIEQLRAALTDLQARAAQAREAGDTDALLTITAETASVNEQLRSALLSRDAETPRITPAIENRQVKTIADMVIEAGIAKRAAAGTHGTLEIRADVFTGADAAAEFQTQRIDETIRQRNLPTVTLLDIIPKVPTDRETVKWFKETGWSNLAAGVARRVAGNYGAYAESGLTVVPVTTTANKVGTYLRTDRDTMTDAPQLYSLLNGRLPDMINQTLEAELLAQTPDPLGIGSISDGAQTGTYTTTTILDDIRKAATLAEKALYPADFVVISPAMHELIQLEKDTLGRYLGAGPFAGPENTIWGLRVIKSLFVDDSNALHPYGRVIVGSTKGLELVYRRGLEITTSENVGNDFLSDAITIKGSVRAALRNIRPEAIVVLTQA